MQIDQIDLSPQELLELMEHLTPPERAELDRLLTEGQPLWVPQVGPQTEALESPADIVFYGGSAGGGKALALDTPLPTPTGWTTMGAVRLGDELFDEMGKPCRVVAVSPVMIGRPCHMLRFSDGAEIVADAEHLWLTMDEAERELSMRRDPDRRARRRASRQGRGTGKRPDLAARNAAAGGRDLPDVVGSVRSTVEIHETLLSARGALNHSVAVAKPLETADGDLTIDPYLLGAWLGDGNSRHARITMAEQEMVCLIEQSASRHGWSVTKGSAKYDYGVVGGMQVALRSCGVLAMKHIPAQYLRASAEQRIALLQGLMDTDGYADPRGQCEFTSTNHQLANDAAELIRSLGCKAQISVGDATLNGRLIGPKYRIKFMAHFPAFRLPRKAAVQQKDSFRPTVFRRYITSADPVASVPVRCVQVDSPSRMYLAGRDMVPTHNSELLLGAALTRQEHSIIFRRQAVQLVGLEERMAQILGSRGGYNGTTGVWRLPGNKVLEFGSLKEPEDWMKYQGRPHDGIFWDEICHFLEIQFRTLCGWMRTDNPNVRQRVICAGNPPTDSDGEWVIRFWAPWLDPQHPNPAKSGELRWFVTDADGKDMEVPGPDKVKVGDEWMVPKSRTFIRSSVDDNLYLQATGYKSTLQALPEPLRSQMLRGDFQAGRTDPVWQAIPTEWIKAAQARWQPRQDKGPMTALGLDPSRGGIDKTCAARRHGPWFDELVSVPATVTKDGPSAAGFVVPLVRNGACICVDSIGIGSSALDFLVGLNLNVLPIVASEASGSYTIRGNLRFKNRRAEMYWRLREALDPAAEVPISLPPDQELLGDLAAVRYKVVQMGTVACIQMRDKDEIREALGRSPDKGDSVAMTFVSGIPAPGAKRKSAPREHPNWRAM